MPDLNSPQFWLFLILGIIIGASGASLFWTRCLESMAQVLMLSSRQREFLRLLQDGPKRTVEIHQATGWPIMVPVYMAKDLETKGLITTELVPDVEGVRGGRPSLRCHLSVKGQRALQIILMEKDS